MKTYLINYSCNAVRKRTPLLVSIFSLLVILLSSSIVLADNGASNKELVFRNGVLESGTAGADGSVYRFRKVDSDIDALVKITARSGSLVKLVSIDLNNTGWDKALQPQVTYNNGTADRATEWWMEFEVTFVNKDKNTAATVNGFDVTGLDIDGNGDKIREYLSFYKPKSYLLENSSLLKVSSLLDLLLGLLTPGKRFDGPFINYANIDTSGTAVMVTNTYEKINAFRFRTGGVSTGASGAADRMYSLYFKSFKYEKPAEFTLPLVLNSFTASLSDKKVLLNWETGMEKELSHFVVERSTDGIEYTEAGIVFTMGNSTVKKMYSFTDAADRFTKNVIYYRLKMVDLDKQYQYSMIRVIKPNAAAATYALQAYPNPVVNEVRITIPAAWQNKEVSYDVYNANGLMVKHVNAAVASQTEVVNLRDLEKGIYVVKAYTKNEMALQRVVKN